MTIEDTREGRQALCRRAMPLVKAARGGIALLASWSALEIAFVFADRGGAECSICGELTGSGPIGCSDDEPICDRCLIEGCHELGMVLALVAITRGVARLEPPTEQQARDALDELGKFAKVYEQIAARLGPPRPFRIPGTDEPAH